MGPGLQNGSSFFETLPLVGIAGVLTEGACQVIPTISNWRRKAYYIRASGSHFAWLLGVQGLKWPLATVEMQGS